MNTIKNVGYPGIDMYPMKQVNINGTQPLGADHAVFYPVITAATTSSVSGTAPKNAIVEVFRRPTIRASTAPASPSSAARSRTAAATGR